MAKTSAAKIVKKETAKPAPVKAKAPTPKAKVVAKPVAVAAPVAKVVAKPATKPAKLISAQDRYHMIDEAAYYRAEKSGFQVDPHGNWVAAEKEIDELLSKQGIKVG